MESTPGRSWQELSITLEGGHVINLEAWGAIHALVAAYHDRNALRVCRKTT